MTFAISLVVAILTISQPAQAFRQQAQKRNVDGISQTMGHSLIQQNATDMVQIEPGEFKLGDQVFHLGTYDILEGSVVREGLDLESPIVGNLDKGTTVTALKFAHIPGRRIRAQIEQTPKGVTGWISVLDIGDNFRWAQCRADLCAGLTYCNFNSDKCTYATGSCAAIEIVRPTTTTTTTPEPPAPEIPETPETPETPVNPAPETPETPAGTSSGASPETPGTPEAPDTGGKESSTRRSAGTCAMAAMTLLMYRLNA